MMSGQHFTHLSEWCKDNPLRISSIMDRYAMQEVMDVRIRMRNHVQK